VTVAQPAARVAPPRCGACGYDTTGLTDLRCPECGADLRVAGITRRRRPTGTWAGFVVAALLLLAAWVFLGFTLFGAVVMPLLPSRQTLRHDVRLTSPGSGAYQAIDVIGQGSGWMGERPAMAVRLELVPPAGSPKKPPAPMQVAPGTTAAAVLQWMAQAGLEPTDPRVRDEAQAAAMHALRTLRVRGRFSNGGFSSSSLVGSTGGPFGATNVTVRGSSEHPDLPGGAVFVLWVTLYVACAVFLWRAMRPRRGAG
jgi:hypothetical protein